MSTPEEINAAALPVKSCRCGRIYNQAQWDVLQLVGYQDDDTITEDHPKATRLELRNCSCGNTIIIHVDLHKPKKRQARDPFLEGIMAKVPKSKKKRSLPGLRSRPLQYGWTGDRFTDEMKATRDRAIKQIGKDAVYQLERQGAMIVSRDFLRKLIVHFKATDDLEIARVVVERTTNDILEHTNGWRSPDNIVRMNQQRNW